MMFSQLCRARPRTLWDKIGVRHITADEPRVASNRRRPEESGEVESSADDSRCQLENCTFCDNRICCQVTSYSANEKEEDLKSAKSCLKTTANPAYGLSAKNWLEIEDEENEETVSADVNETMDFNDVRISKDRKATNSLLTPKFHPNIKCASQKGPDCDGDTAPMKVNSLNIQMQNYNQTNVESRTHRIDVANERLKPDAYKMNDPKHGSLTWSVLKHRQLNSDTADNCDKSNSCVIEHSVGDQLSHDPHLDLQEKDALDLTKPKRNLKDRSFPLSLMKPLTKMGDKVTDNLPAFQQFGQTFKTDLSRQRPVQKTSCTKFAPATNRNKCEDPPRFSKDISVANNPLSAIEQIKTEESIQEWLARISDSTNGICADDVDENNKPSHKSAWSLNNSITVSKTREATKTKLRTEASHVLNKGLQEALEMSHIYKESQPNCDPEYPEILADDENTDTSNALCNASKASPANIPMVVMQCSRLHSHIGSKPPFQQTSLPMGTLVTALYQESDWLYVQTPHGVEGFIIAANCVPIGTINDPAHTSRRPWEPCDFPIEINVRRQCEFGRQQGAYIPAKLPTNGNKQAPYVSTVKMKTNFYSDRYFSHTFKSKDSIKTAKTVTDILRNSPETKVSNQ